MTMIREMPDEEKPREKFAKDAALATDEDLVAILLRTGYRGCGVRDLAHEVIRQLGYRTDKEWHGDLNWRDLEEIKGIGRDKAITICAAIELGRRISHRASEREVEHLNEPRKVFRYFVDNVWDQSQEHFFACYLNVKNRLLGAQRISIGNIAAAPVDIKEVMRWGIRYKAYGIILVHNHPSGDPTPSDSDIRLTRKFAAAAELLDMKVLDHVVIGGRKFVSLHDLDLI